MAAGILLSAVVQARQKRLKLSHQALLDWQSIKQKQQTAALNLWYLLQLNHVIDQSLR